MASNLQEIARDVGVREDALVSAQPCFSVWNGPPRRWTATYRGPRAEPLHEELHRGGVQPNEEPAQLIGQQALVDALGCPLVAAR